MKSYELLREVFKKIEPKNVARGLKLSLSLIHQWSRQRDGRSDARNPLDCIVEIMRLTDDLRPLQWLCEQFGGYFVLNPKVKVSGRAEFLSETGSVIQEMAHLQIALGEAVRTGKLTRKEAVTVRNFWEQLKPDMERYSVQCDKGDFYLSKPVASQPRV